MIKKLIITCICLLFVSQTASFADEIIDAKGEVIPCKIETVLSGLIEYHKNGNRYFFSREEASPVFNDYVDVKKNLFNKKDTTRYFGKIYVKDMWSLIITTDKGDIDVPFYKIKFIGIYKP